MRLTIFLIAIYVVSEWESKGNHWMAALLFITALLGCFVPAFAGSLRGLSNRWRETWIHRRLNEKEMAIEWHFLAAKVVKADGEIEPRKLAMATAALKEELAEAFDPALLATFCSVRNEITSDRRKLFRF